MSPENKHLTQVQSSTAPASPRGGCAHGRLPRAVRAPALAAAPSPGTLVPAASAGLRLPFPSRTWPGGSSVGPAQTAKWQARYGREPTDQQRAWLVNKVRTDIAMKATKLNAQVQLTNLQAMYERGTATSDQRRQLDLEYQDWARLH